jgi:hypothetical protein
MQVLLCRLVARVLEQEQAQPREPYSLYSIDKDPEARPRVEQGADSTTFVEKVALAMFDDGPAVSKQARRHPSLFMCLARAAGRPTLILRAPRI